MSEKKKRQQALDDARKTFPGPKSCSDASNAMPGIRKALADSQAKVAADPKANVAPRYVIAYTTILNEYIGYYNSNNCSLVPQGDSILASAVVSPGASPQVVSPIVNDQVNAANSSSAVAADQLITGMPNWATWALAGTILLIGVIVVLKK